MILTLQPVTPVQRKPAPHSGTVLKPAPTQKNPLHRTLGQDLFHRSKSKVQATRQRQESLLVENRATIKDIMDSGEHQKFFCQPGTKRYFMIDPTKTRIVSREEKATSQRNAGKELKRDALGQIMVTTSFPQNENSDFFVLLKGVVIENADDERLKYEPIPDSPSALESVWLKRKQESKKKQPLPRTVPFEDQPIKVDVVVRFENLSPDGYTNDLEVFSRDELKKIFRGEYQKGI